MWAAGCKSWYKNADGQGHEQLVELDRPLLVEDAPPVLDEFEQTGA